MTTTFNVRRLLDEVELDDPAQFQRTLLKTTAAGLGGALLAVGGSLTLGRGPLVAPGAVMVLSSAVVLLATCSGGTATRLALLAAAGATAAFVPTSTAPWAFVAALAVALAVGRPSRKERLLAFAATLVGALWFAGVADAIGAHHGRLLDAAQLATTLAFGLFVGLALVIVHVVGRTAAVGARLRRAAASAKAADVSLLDRSRELWERLTAAIARLPASAERDALNRHAHTAARAVLDRAHESEALRALLGSLDSEWAKTQRVALVERAGQTADAATRESLVRAAQHQSDGLEQIASLERRRDRAAAELTLALSVLEKAALAVELTPISREGLRDTVSRLATS